MYLTWVRHTLIPIWRSLSSYSPKLSNQLRWFDERGGGVGLESSLLCQSVSCWPCESADYGSGLGSADYSSATAVCSCPGGQRLGCRRNHKTLQNIQSFSSSLLSSALTSFIFPELARIVAAFWSFRFRLLGGVGRGRVAGRRWWASLTTAG